MCVCHPARLLAFPTSASTPVYSWVIFPWNTRKRKPQRARGSPASGPVAEGHTNGWEAFHPLCEVTVACGEVWNRGWAISSKQQQINIIVVARDHVASVRGTGGPQNLSVILELCLHLFADSQLIECRNSKLDKYSIFTLKFSKPVCYMRNGWTLGMASPL